MKRVYAVYGASGFGREVMPLARLQLEAQGLGSDSLIFIDDNMAGKTLNGIEVFSYASFMQLKADERFVSIAIAKDSVRQKIAKRCLEDGVKVWSIQAKSCVVMDEVAIGEGAILCPFVTLTSNIKIGKHFHANIYSYVAHDCVIGDFVTFAPSVKCNGNVIVGDNSYIGTGAIIKQGTLEKPLIIGAGAVVGMGAVVTKDVEPNAVVVGNPARVLPKVEK